MITFVFPSQYLAPWSQVVGALISCVVISYIFFRILRKDSERPIGYVVSIPEQCKPKWKGEILEEPSIKVRT